jgi:hypothetical protein
MVQNQTKMATSHKLINMACSINRLINITYLLLVISIDMLPINLTRLITCCLIKVLIDFQNDNVSLVTH